MRTTGRQVEPTAVVLIGGNVIAARLENTIVERLKDLEGQD
jgi:hypothetical protein